ncbi:MAG: hypothetical protein OXF74_10415 [Rhodobacteraceae bacterium]|nr:hypothetical protein [Paracoccaceae bacterium]
MTFDVAWRYSDLDEARTGQGGGREVRHDGTGEPVLLNLSPNRTKVRGHGIRWSLRYSF